MKYLILALSFFTIVGCQSSRMHKHHDHMKKMWTEMDTNNDQSVSKDEFMKAHEAKFNLMDENKDGSVNKEERKAFMKRYMETGCCKKDGKAGCSMMDGKCGKDCKGGCKGDCKDCKGKCGSGGCKLDEKKE